MDHEVMIGLRIGKKRPVLVRTKHGLFGAVIIGTWHDKRSGLSGPLVNTPEGAAFNVDWKRIVRFTDTDEIPWFKEEEICLD